MSDTGNPRPEKPDAPVTDPRASGGGSTDAATATEAPEVDPHDAPDARGERSRSLLREIASGDALAGVLAVLLAVFVGSVMIAATDETVRETAGYITARPSDFFTALWDAISGAYSAMFRGAIFNGNVAEPAQQWRPLT